MEKQMHGIQKTVTIMLWPLAVYFGLIVALVIAILSISYVLGERHNEPATGAPYEGGIVSQGSARVRFAVRFYLIAMFFVIFDLETAFVFAWAVAARELGWRGYWEMLVFIGVLIAALAYLWRIGALEWSPERMKRNRHALDANKAGNGGSDFHPR